MKQIIQDIKSGQTILEEVPTPSINSGSVLIKTTRSLVSLGTEKMLVDFGKASYIQKAKQQPDKVKMVLDKMKADGVLPTIEAVFNKLGTPMPLGYCNVGVVEKVGDKVSHFNVGDRVVSNGNHAEFVSVPENLVAKIPDDVSDEEAVFTVIGSIGLQGIRLLKPTFGETVVVIGLGLIGLITVEILKANGCNVIGFDFDDKKVDIAKSKGISAFKVDENTNQVELVNAATNNIGADGVIITASNRSNRIISQSAQMCRKKGRIVLVGVIGLDISRADFYEKEISFQVSCSYGPGRYDNLYEQKGVDYPIGYVRWTEKRNFEAILKALSKKQIDVKPLITAKIPLENYLEIYNNMDNKNSIASILVYSKKSKSSQTIKIATNQSNLSKAEIGIIGAGNFTSSTLLPHLKKNNANISYIASNEGLSSTVLAKKFDILNSTTDYKKILSDPKINLVLVTTRHNNHAEIVIEGLKAGKNIFVEKPLVIRQKDLDKIIECYKNSTNTVTVGFNRRFSPFSKKIKQLLGSSSTPLNITATFNAGYIPEDSWLHDMEIGGGRILGEACHYMDLCTYLTGSKIHKVCMSSMGENPKENTDNASILLKYENGSNVVINYFANGSKAYSKERIEIFSEKRTLVLDNWRKLTGYGFNSFNRMTSRQDKGHFNQFKELLYNEKNTGTPIILFDEIVNTTQSSLAALKSLKESRWVNINE
jgi:predicted dehydrogenase/threonine dehydrogenase-like Zn-dependent dehydrogenase